MILNNINNGLINLLDVVAQANGKNKAYELEPLQYDQVNNVVNKLENSYYFDVHFVDESAILAKFDKEMLNTISHKRAEKIASILIDYAKRDIRNISKCRIARQVYLIKPSDEIDYENQFAYITDTNRHNQF